MFLPDPIRISQVASFVRHHQPGKSRVTGNGGGNAGDDRSKHSRWLGWDGERREGGGGLPFGYYLDLDALTVARAAACCGANCSALFYAEAWLEGRFGEAAGITASRWRDQEEGSSGDSMDWLDSVGGEEISVGDDSTGIRLVR